MKTCKWQNTLLSHSMIVGNHWIACGASYRLADDRVVHLSEIVPMSEVNEWDRETVYNWLGY